MELNNIFKNKFQLAIESYDRRTGIFKSNKPIHLAPPIDYEDGEWYILENGNRILKSKYNSMWHPVKTPIKPFGYKGEDPDKTKIP